MVHKRCATIVGMVDIASADEAEIVGTAVTASPLAVDAPVMIPVGRYISADFAALEYERMWPRVWHLACTVDHVANPGDWFEHRLGRYSILLVRGDDGALRAFQNVCRHRGNTICQGSGSGIDELRCPYHRWAWDLGGRLRFPNTTVLVSADLFTVLSARPGPSPDEAELAILQLDRTPSADAPASSPVHVTVPMDQADFGFVLNQDFSVIRTMQTGLHQPGLTHVLLGAEECRIINMNRHLERYLGLEPGGTEPVPAR